MSTAHTYNNRKHPHGFPLSSINLCPLPLAVPVLIFIVALAGVRQHGHTSVFTVRAVRIVILVLVQLLQGNIRVLVDDGRQRGRQAGEGLQRRSGLLELLAGLHAALQFGLACLLPVPQAAEHPAVQQKHDGTGHEKRADGGVDHVVVVLQLALAVVPVGDVVDAEHHGRCHRQRQDPCGGKQDNLALVHVLAVVIERDGYRDEPAVNGTECYGKGHAIDKTSIKTHGWTPCVHQQLSHWLSF